jgi:hypothetical protein
MTLPIVDERLDGLMIHVEDITRTGHCVRGTRRWFEGYGFDFRQVIKHGIPAKDLLLTNDAHAIAVIRAKLDRMDNQNG